jgi:hypothetical protein
MESLGYSEAFMPEGNPPFSKAQLQYVLSFSPSSSGTLFASLALFCFAKGLWPFASAENPKIC